MRGDGGVVSAASLRTDLELARQEIRDLRAERDKLRETIRRQLDTISTKDLTTRIGELTRHNQQLTGQASHAAADSQALRARVAELEADLAAARTSLRRMIRDENRPAAVAPPG
jgi:septal ring factor EnvC (AmiA/AmiB activator)